MLIEVRFAVNVGRLPALLKTQRQVQVERIVAVEGVHDARDLRRLAHQPRLARRHRFIGASLGGGQQDRPDDERRCAGTHRQIYEARKPARRRGVSGSATTCTAPGHPCGP